MKKNKILLIYFLLGPALSSLAQTERADTTVSLDAVVISANKTEEPKRNVAQEVQVITAGDMAVMNAQTTADVLSATGMVNVQKSQQGGGSPVIRGFEASRILLVVDGIRMNNIIYRAGHLQNIITVDHSILERAEILFGPASTIYGSDALGGAIHFFTRKPSLSNDEKPLIKVNALSRYGDVNKEKTGHLDVNYGTRNFASLTSFTYSQFDDLRGGRNQNPAYNGSYGERPYYAERINGTDSLVKNSDRYLQVQSGYSQYDLLQKFLFQQNVNSSHQLNVQYSNSTDIPRYDRLTDPAANGLRFAQWYYGPQMRLLGAYDFNSMNSGGFFQNLHAGINYQKIEESRHTRRFGQNNLTHRTEKVDVIGLNADVQRIMNHHTLRLGLDVQYNKLKSVAHQENIVTGEIKALDTRYPGGDNNMMQSAVYVSHTWKINNEVTVTDGVRAGYSKLHSEFNDTSFYPIPYSEANQNTAVYSGSAGIIHAPSENWKLSLLFSTGYRVPNADDLAKVFESVPGSVIVPNPDLKPERTVTSEAGITHLINRKTSWENSFYYTSFRDAIVTEPFLFTGKDSIEYDGALSRVLANQNKRKAFIYGFSTTMRSKCSPGFEMLFTLNYTYGRIKTDSTDQPLDHIPPIGANLQLDYTHQNFGACFFILHNGWKRLKNYSTSGEDNAQYATPDGMPAWFTVNARISCKVHKLITLQAGVDNIFDTQYRVFASGINGPGRNVFGAIRFHY